MVNLDRDVLQLVCEAHAMAGLGLDVPQAALLAMAQEEKLQTFHAQLSQLLQARGGVGAG